MAIKKGGGIAASPFRKRKIFCGSGEKIVFRAALADAISTNLALTCVFTAISIVRGYTVRRLFNWWHGRGRA